jgi:hypothetical protein
MIRPGDAVTCACCGAQARAQWTPLDRPWQEGYPLLLTWTHGPHPRTEATHVAPERCIWCEERCNALGGDAPPLYRPAPGAEPGELTPAIRCSTCNDTGIPVGVAKLPNHYVTVCSCPSGDKVPVPNVWDFDPAETTAGAGELPPQPAPASAAANLCERCGNPPGEHAGTKCPEDRPAVECRTCGEKHDGTCIDASCWLALTQDEKERLCGRPRLARGFAPPVSWKYATLHRVAQRDVSAAREHEFERADRARAQAATPPKPAPKPRGQLSLFG